jgi:polysaccharide biosynthesis transport protein
MDALTGNRIRPLTILAQEWPETEPNLAPRSSTSDDAVQTFKQVLDSIRKYKPFIVRMIAVGVLLAGAAGVLMSPSYTATTQLVVNTRNSDAGDAAGSSGAAAAPSANTADAIIDTHVTVLSSDNYLLRLLPPLRALDRARDAREVQTWTKRARAFFRKTWSKAKALLSISEHPDGDALAELRRRLIVAQERRSKIISVSFTDANPERAAEYANLIARSYVDEVSRQKQTIETQALNAVAVRSSAVQRELSKAKAELDASRLGQPSSPQSDAFEWQMTTLAQQLEMLLRQRQEAIAKGLFIEPEVSMIADASPPELPGSLNPLFLIPPVTIVFAVFACLLAVVFNRFDRALHTETEAAEALRIPCAGLIPSIALELRRKPLQMLQQAAIEYARAIRSTVVSLLACGSAAPQSQRIVLTTSSTRGEGKTAVSWGLGFHAAQLGRRVLLLDLGHLFRRPGGDTPDLFRVLTHDRPPADAIQHIPELGMDYLPAGFSDGNRLWMLASPKISLLFEQLRDAYDFVVIDAPSLQDAPEARLLVRWADHVLLVVRAGSTNRDMARTMLQLLARTEHLNVEIKFWSVLTRRHPSEHDRLDVAQEPRHQRLKAAVRRWMRLEPAIDVANSA